MKSCVHLIGAPPPFPFVYTDIIHMIKWTWHFPFIFAYYIWSKPGPCECLRRRLTPSTLSHPHIVTHTHTVTPTHCHTHTQCHTHTLSHTHTVTSTHCHTHTMSHKHIVTHTLSHPHCHTHTLSHPHTCNSSGRLGRSSSSNRTTPGSLIWKFSFRSNGPPTSYEDKRGGARKAGRSLGMLHPPNLATTLSCGRSSDYSCPQTPRSHEEKRSGEPSRISWERAL